MPVCRLIFRLDFKVNFEIIERSGTVMQILWDAFEKENPKGSELRENKNNRTVTVRFVSENGNFMKHLNVEPTSINGEFKSIEGVEINKLLNNTKGFVFLTKLAGQLCERFQIDRIIRSGLRLFYLNKLGKQDGDIVRAYQKIFNTEVIDNFENKLGTVQDYAIVLDGASEDGVYYHFSTGPYRAEEAQKFFHEIANKFSEQADYDMICDLDLYENNFSLSNRSLSNLYRPIIAKAQNAIETLESEITKNLEE
jgi:hypothetical protein